MQIKDRIKEFIAKEGISIRAFEKRIGKSNGYVNNIVNTISAEVLTSISKSFPDLNVSWLLTGEGPMLKEEEASKTEIVVAHKEHTYTLKQLITDYAGGADVSGIDDDLLQKDLSNMTDYDIDRAALQLKTNSDDLKFGISMIESHGKRGKMVPIIGTSASAGTAIVELSGTREGWVNVGDLLSDSEAAFYVYGNSMIPGYPPGCMVGLKRRYDSFIEPGSIYIVQTQTNRYIKRLYYNKDNTAFVCLSDNHIKHTDGPMEGEYIYPPFEIKIEDVTSIWDVTGVIKRNKSIMLL